MSLHLYNETSLNRMNQTILNVYALAQTPTDNFEKNIIGGLMFSFNEKRTALVLEEFNFNNNFFTIHLEH